MFQTAPKLMEVESLHFDPANPRLAEFGVRNDTPEEEILKILWDAMDVQELVMSMAASGFFQHEALIACEENGKLIVIEGNRRLAALKILLNPGLADQLQLQVPSVPISAQNLNSLKSVPVLLSPRAEAWQYLGFKHINGPAKWASYAKSRFIADIHLKQRIPLADIASQIGDRHSTVRRLYRGFLVLQQAEKAKLFDKDDIFNRRFSFSHLYTGLQYPGFQDFLGLEDSNDDSEEPVPEDRRKNLNELLFWLYGSKKEDKKPLIVSQNPDLRSLDTCLQHSESLAALRDGVSLAEAVQISRPTAEVFEESLWKAKRELQKAKGFVTNGYRGDTALLKIAGTVAELADDLYSEMERKTDRPKKRLTMDD